MERGVATLGEEKYDGRGISGNADTNDVFAPVTTTAPSRVVPRLGPMTPGAPRGLSPRVLFVLLLLMLTVGWGMARRNRHSARRWLAPLLPLAGGLLLTAALAGCGGGGGGGGGGGTPHNSGTPAGTYTLTVTATTGSGSSTVRHNVTLTLIVS